MGLTTAPARRGVTVLALTYALWTVSACALFGEPTERLDRARAAIAAARSVGAADFAPNELATAEDKLVRAEIAAHRKQYDEAEHLAEAAEIDAQLANLRARAAMSEPAGATRGGEAEFRPDR